MIYNKIGDYKMLKIKVQETKPKKPSVFKLREQLVENQTYGATVVKVEVIPPHEAFSSLNITDASYEVVRIGFTLKHIPSCWLWDFGGGPLSSDFCFTT